MNYICKKIRKTIKPYFLEYYLFDFKIVYLINKQKTVNYARAKY